MKKRLTKASACILRLQKCLTFASLYLFLILVNPPAYAQQYSLWNITSPDKLIKVTINAYLHDQNENFGTAAFKIVYKDKKGKLTEMLRSSMLGISTDSQNFGNNLSLLTAGRAITVHEQYHMVTGKRSKCENSGTQRSFRFINKSGHILTVIFRVYNDGVAFRYLIPSAKDTAVHVISEHTCYHVPDSAERWTQPYNAAYEDFFKYSGDGKGEKGQQWGYPALFKIDKNPLWMLISEADNSKYNCAARLSNVQNHNEYNVVYPEPRGDFNQTGVIAPLPWQSQWHTLIIGTLNTVVQSTLITDVADHRRFSNTGWCVPGAVAWVYWANNHGSKDFKKVKEYVDLAKYMGWPYVLIDWEWDVMSNGGNVIDAVNYAHSNGIKPMLWYNSGTASWADATPVDRLKERGRRVKEFEWLNKIGVYGIKIDFFAGDQQDMMKYYLELLQDAATYHLMVNFHGATVPKGWARTYPNLMSTEAVYGAEWYNNLPVLTNTAARHNTTLPFTRNVIGSMDYTPVTFSNSQHPHITTYGHELALSVVFESGLQHFADRPEVYENLPDAPRNFLKTVPTAWDETKLLNGFPGKYVVIARRKGNTWYIGGLNGLDTAQILTIPLYMLKSQKSEIHMIKDGKNDKSFTSEIWKTDNDQTIKVDCLPRGGFAAFFTVK